MNHRSSERIFLVSCLLGVLLLAFFLFLPFLTTIALAGTFAIVLNPFQERLTKLFRGRATLATIVTMLLLFVLLLLPLSFVVFQVFQESRDVYQTISGNSDAYIQAISQLFDRWIKPYAPTFNLEISSMLRQGASYLVGHLGTIFSGTAQTVLSLFLGLITLFYFLRDGKKFVQTFTELSPLPDRYDENIVKHLNGAVNSVIRGSVFIALIQGAFTGIGFWIFGVPNPALWGSIAAICALIPGVGTSLVLIPAIAYLFFSGETVQGVGMLLWGMFAVGTIDNILGPQLVGQHIKIHPIFILFSVLGGISMFGPFGFIFGPLVMSLLVALVEIWKMVSTSKH